MTDKQQMIESLRILKAHCVHRDTCEGCELEEVCELLFNQDVKDWELD